MFGDGLFLKGDNPERSYSGELQYILRRPGFKLVAGGGYFKVAGHLDTLIGIHLPPFGDFEFPDPRISTNLRHTNAYAYSNINISDSLTLTAGLSGDFMNGDSDDVGKRDQVNPKLGLTWEPTKATTVRAAAFRALKRTLITNQTLEPTQVAGFNQFFDDFDVTDYWRFGAAVDHKFTRNLAGGIEISRRNVKSPFLTSDGGGEDRMTEYSGRTYLFWTAADWLALSAGYSYDRLKSDGATFNPESLNTHRFPFGVSVFGPSGWSGGVKATYYKQEGRLNGQYLFSGFSPNPAPFGCSMHRCTISYRSDMARFHWLPGIFLISSLIILIRILPIRRFNLVGLFLVSSQWRCRDGWGGMCVRTR